MCMCVWLFDDHPLYRLLLASNRDELHSRPTTASHYWCDDASILGGRDGEKGGTWLGIHKNGRLALLTNYREPASDPHALTRGELTTHFLQSDKSPTEYLQQLAGEVNHYNGFNLVVGDLVTMEMAYLPNRPTCSQVQPQRLTCGIHGLSNALLDTPWPKVELAKKRLKALLDTHGTRAVPLVEVIENVLYDREKCEDHLLPSTGCSIEWERELSPAFVECETPHGRYGTRSCIAIAVNKNGQVEFHERYLEGGLWKDHVFTFTIDIPQ